MTSTRSRLTLCTLGLLLGAGAAPAAETNKGDLTLQARAVLRRYCAECHFREGETSGAGELSVLERAGLSPAGRADRPFLKSGAAAGESQLLLLMDDGSMPPGDRPKPTEAERRIVREWISAGAPDYPRRFDEEYARAAILHDVTGLSPAERPKVRYISLHNLIPDADPAFVLEPQREALRRALAQLTKKPTTLKPVDAVESIVRIDLGSTGWDATPFNRRYLDQGIAKTERSDVTLFDLILVEYPFARLEPASESFKQLSELFLKPARQVVPVCYLRGDWFVADFARSEVAREIRSALELPPAAAASPGPFRSPAAPADARGTPIIPLDSVDRSRKPPQPDDLIAFFDTWDADKRASKSKFMPGDKLLIYVRPNRQVFIEVVWQNADGTCSIPNLGANNLVDARMDKFIGGQKNGGYRIKDGVFGKEYLTIFACESRFPPGRLLKTRERLNERVIHPFYTLPAPNDRIVHPFYPPEGVKNEFDFDPARIYKKTIEIEIVRKVE